MPDLRPGPSAGRLLVVVPLIGIVAGACGPSAAGSAEGSPSQAVTQSPALVVTPPAVATSGAPAVATSPSPLVVDPSLLAILPASVAGVDIQASPETAAGMIADAGLAESASALAVGAAIAPGGDDLAISTVVRLRPGVFDDAFYASWRASYDEAACAPAGGVASHERQRIGGHEVEQTVCTGGARTYHTHLDGDVLVSITAVGDREFGTLVMAGLRG